MMKRFDHRTVIVTGGARGMGASHARGFIAEGANVVIADVLEQEGRTLADELGDQAIFSRLDVTSDADWAATVAAAEDTFGPVSVLINNAGIVRFGVIAETELAAWRQVIDINLTGTYLGIRAVVPSMRKAGGAGARARQHPRQLGSPRCYSHADPRRSCAGRCGDGGDDGGGRGGVIGDSAHRRA